VRKEQEQGLIVMDQFEEQSDLQFIRQMERYYIRTIKGSQRADWIVPAPFFSSSYLSVPIQAADVCIYCLNWGFRRPAWGMNAPTRSAIEQDFSGWVGRLEWKAQIRKTDGTPKKYCGICFVQNPYGPGGP
jgi:hypothetical protein